MAGRPLRLKLNWQHADSLITAVHSQQPVGGLTHNFYKYPARFSPQFASAAICALSDPGDLIADPFVGGGTSLVEARVNGRIGFGTDISTLATFVSKTKTRVLTGADFEYLSRWFELLPDKINMHDTSSVGQHSDIDYTRNLDGRETWAMRKAIALSLAAVKRIRDKRRQDFARCVLLRTAQWALDGRREVPSVQEFRERIWDTADSLIEGAQEFATSARRADAAAPSDGRRRTVCLNGRAESLADYIGRADRGAPRLIVTSPPYPGVHVLYHRWQIQGRRETPAPFWIANKLDGAGEAHYLMHARNPDLEKYTAGIEAAFTALAEVSQRNTTVIQLVAFSDPESQLPHYLDVMHRCGFHEYLLSEYVDSKDGRIWRDIPGRKWQANSKGQLSSSKEVVLIHRPR